MNNTDIAINADKVWYALNEKQDVTMSVSELALRLNMDSNSVILAAGWLAKEHRICVCNESETIILFIADRFSCFFG